MITRRAFLQGVGVSALAVAAPVVGRRIWQVSRNAPVKTARIYDADAIRWQWRTTLDERTRPEHAALDGVEFPMPPMHYNCRSQFAPLGVGELVDDDDDGMVGRIISQDRVPIGIITEVNGDGSFMVEMGRQS